MVSTWPAGKWAILGLGGAGFGASAGADSGNGRDSGGRAAAEGRDAWAGGAFSSGWPCEGASAGDCEAAGGCDSGLEQVAVAMATAVIVGSKMRDVVVLTVYLRCARWKAALANHTQNPLRGDKARSLMTAEQHSFNSVTARRQRSHIW